MNDLDLILVILFPVGIAISTFFTFVLGLLISVLYNNRKKSPKEHLWVALSAVHYVYWAWGHYLVHPRGPRPDQLVSIDDDGYFRKADLTGGERP